MNAKRGMQSAESKLAQWGSLALLSALCLLPFATSRLDSASDAIVGYNRIEDKAVHREWNSGSSAWEDENLSVSVSGSENIPQVVKIYSPPPGSLRPSERIKLVLNNDGRLLGMVYNGASWGNITTLTTGLAAQVSYLPFDGAYELTNSSFVAVYSAGGTADGSQALWASWDGTQWTTSRALPAEPGALAYRWIRVEAQPKEGANRILALGADTGGELYALWWDGSAWGNWTTLTDGALLGNTIEGVGVGRAFDIAFASSTGRAYAIAAIADVIDVTYSDDGGGWNAMAATGDLDPSNGSFNWLFAAYDPSGAVDRVIVTTLDTQGDITFAALVNGAWQNATADTSLETGAQSATLPVLGLAFEATTGEGMLAYAQSGLTAPRYRTWTQAGGLGAEQAMTANFGGLSINSLKVIGDRNSDDIWVAGENNRGRLMFTYWDGATGWSAAQLVTAYTAFVAQRSVYDLSQDVIAYARNDQKVPYREVQAGTNNWDNTDSFSNDIEGTPRWVKIIASPKENQKLMATLANTGQVLTQVWNGSIWGSTESLTTSIDADNGRDYYRGFDLAYERNGGDALVVYSVNSAVPQYRTRAKGASAWSSELPVPNWPGSGAILWVRVEPNPTESSNEMVLMTLDTNNDIFATVWDGTNSVSGSTVTLTTATNAINTQQTLHVA